jgi:hypothetical protein
MERYSSLDIFIMDPCVNCTMPSHEAMRPKLDLDLHVGGKVGVVAG